MNSKLMMELNMKYTTITLLGKTSLTEKLLDIQFSSVQSLS